MELMQSPETILLLHHLEARERRAHIDQARNSARTGPSLMANIRTVIARALIAIGTSIAPALRYGAAEPGINNPSEACETA